jgi:hypothetical protein
VTPSACAMPSRSLPRLLLPLLSLLCLLPARSLAFQLLSAPEATRPPPSPSPLSARQGSHGAGGQKPGSDLAEGYMGIKNYKPLPPADEVRMLVTSVIRARIPMGPWLHREALHCSRLTPQDPSVVVVSLLDGGQRL